LTRSRKTKMGIHPLKPRPAEMSSRLTSVPRDPIQSEPPSQTQAERMTPQAWQNLILSQLHAQIATASPREIKAWLELMVRGRKLYAAPKPDPKIASAQREAARAAVIAKIEQMLDEMDDPNWVAPVID
jgi:hypothetical protein